ncbi:MAG TPA: hypothetical protein VEJ41_02390 [Candidatus Acidoferrales bacterium]|nr:hypothetical protein [Candidatus Acidoferrales bacterium]
MANIAKNQRNATGAQALEPTNPGVVKAREQLSRGDMDGAAVTLRQLLKQPDLSLNTRLDAAKALGTAGATADAIATFLDAGRKALDAGDLAIARSSFASAHTLDQKSYDALFELGRVDLAENKREQALEKFVEVLRKSNLRHLPALYEAAVLYEGDGQTDQAIAAYKKIAERDRHHVPTLTRLANLYRKKNQLGDALGFYLQGARAAMAAMQYKEARALVDSALQIEDDNWEARRLESELAKVETPQPKAPEAKQAAAARPAAPARPAAAAPPPPPAKPVAAPMPSAPRTLAPTPAPKPVAAPAPPAASAKPVAPAPVPAPQKAPPPAAAVQAPTPVAQAPKPVAPAPPAPSAQNGTTSTPTTTQSSPAEPAVIGSDMDTDLPPEVMLLEKQSEVTSKLAAITAEVAEAYKKRVAIERDIKAAQAALEGLNSQRGDVESSIAALKAQLDQVTAAKAAEDKALDDLRAKLEDTRANLEKLAALPQFISEIEAKSSGVATVIANATSTLEAAQKRVADAAGSAGAVEKTASELMARITAARTQADEVQTQLQAVLGESKSAKADAVAAAGSIAELKTTVATLAQLKTQVDAARKELSALSPAIEAKKAQAQAAIGQIDQKRVERDAQFAAAASQVAGTPAPTAPVAAPKAPPVAAAPPPPAAPAKPAATAPAAAAKKPEAGKVDVDGLVASGRLDDALRAARASANGAPDQDAKFVEAAQRLRESGNAAAAAKACEKLVSSGSTSAAGRYCLALAYVDLKRYKEAQTIFEALPEAEYGVLRENGVGLCLRGLGRTDEAAQHFSKALEIPGQPDGQYRDVLYNLADLYESRGDQESLNLALWSFEEIQAGAPDYRDVGDRITALKDQLSKIEVPEPSPVLTRDGRGGRDSKF